MNRYHAQASSASWSNLLYRLHVVFSLGVKKDGVHDFDRSIALRFYHDSRYRLYIPIPYVIGPLRCHISAHWIEKGQEHVFDRSMDLL
jgi:hypothetical protein